MFDPDRPKMSIRRWEQQNPGETTMGLALREYDSNRGFEAEPASLKNVYRTIEAQGHGSPA